MPPEPQRSEDYAYDVFISYSHQDADWVRGWLLPRLEDAHLRVCIDFRDFKIGVPSLVNMEHAVERSRRTLLVLTPNWVGSEWTNFEALMIQTQDPIGRARRMLPLMLEDCELPGRLAIFTFADFRRRESRDAELARLLGQMGEVPKMPPVQLTTKPTPKVSLAKLPPTDPVLFGREQQLALLDEAWENPDINVVSLVAWGGVGKTALVNRWLLGMGQDGYRGAERVYGWSFYSQGAKEGGQASADPFIAAALDWFDDPDPTAGSPWQKGERLAGLVRGRRTLLILDGLEPLQYPPGEMEGRLKDPGLQCLLRGLARHNPGLCVVTTRLAVDELKDFVGTSAQRVDLEHLSPPAGAAYLAHLGVEGTPEELERAAREFDGHALALTLLGRYLAVAHNGDVRKRDRIPALTEERRQGGHARRVVVSYERWFEGQPELDILRVMGLFDRPAEPGAIQALRAEPVIAGLTERLQGLSEADYRYAVANLRRVRLLAEGDPQEPDTLDCHPLVREHFGERLERSHPDAWGEAHGRLYEYHKTKAPEYPDTLEEVIPLYAAVAHGCRAGRHQEALDDVYWRRIQRGNEVFSTKRLGAIGADLAALSDFFDPPWHRAVAGLTEVWRSWVLNEAGFRLRALGRLAEAAQPMQAGLEALLAQENWGQAARAAGNLSQLHLSLGELAQALAYAEQSVDLADRSGDGFQRLSKRTTLADALHQAGRIEEAETLFREAEAMQEERQPQFPLLYSGWGYWYCDLLLGRGQAGEVLRRAEEALEIVLQGSRNLIDIALNHLALGRAYLMQAVQEGTSPSTGPRASFSQAAHHLDRAVDGLREAGWQDYLPRGLLTLAALHRARGHYGKAQRDLEEALTIVTRGGMRLHEADCHLEAARLHLACGQQQDAREHLEAAKAMIEDTGYHRRDDELAALEEQL
jgi:tetratricopeptide (TPR) repeat protein